MKSKYTGPDGFRQFAKDFRKYAAEMGGERLKSAITRVCAIVTRDAKAHSPVGNNKRGLPGNLRRSIQYNVKQNGAKVMGYVGSDVEYAPHVEFGTRWIRVGSPENPRTDWDAKRATGTTSDETMPFLRPAIFKKRDEIIRALRNTLEGR